MTETRTSRFALPRYGAGTDMLERLDYNELVDSLEANAAIDAQGSSLPSAGTIGKYFYDSVTELQYRDTGSAWKIVGSKVRDAYSKPSATNKVALTLQTIVGHTVNLFEALNNDGTVKNVYIDANGNIGTKSDRMKVLSNPGADEAILTLTTAGDTELPLELKILDTSTKNFIEAKKVSGGTLFKIESTGTVNSPKVITNEGNFNSQSTSIVTLVVKGTSGQTANLQGWRDNTGTVLAYVDPTGKVAGKTLEVTNSTSMSMDTANHGLLIGVGTGDNVSVNNSKIQARTNSAPAPLFINSNGGRINMGDGVLTDSIRMQAVSVEARGPFHSFEDSVFDGDVDIDGKTATGDLSINGHNLYVQGDAPSTPIEGDLWFQVVSA